MKVTARLIAAGLLLVALGVSERVQAEEPKYYLVGFAGPANPEDLSNVDSNLNPLVFTPDIPLSGESLWKPWKWGDNPMFGLKFGYVPHKDNTWFGLEFEYFHMNSELESPVLFPQSGNLTVHTASLNLILRYPDFIIEPYIGVGPSILFVESFALNGNGRETAPGLNLMAGARLPIFGRLLAFAEYKHSRAELDLAFFNADYRVHAVVLGAGFMF